MAYLLDTNACIALINGSSEPVRKRFSRAVGAKEEVWVPSVSVFELWYGVAKSLQTDANTKRVKMFLEGPVRVLEFVEMGALVQITASSFTGEWGQTALNTACWLLNHDAVHVLATDAHDDSRRPPLLSPGAEEAAKICGDEIAHALVEENPRAIISGKSLPFFPRPVHRR